MTGVLSDDRRSVRNTPAKESRIYTLAYHDTSRGNGGLSDVARVRRGRYQLEWERFLEHLEAIEDVVGAPPAILHQRVEAGRAHVWCLTFDDGDASALAVAEELRRRAWRAYFFIPTGLIGHRGFVDEEAIRDLDRMGHIVGAHSVTHPERMSSLPADRLSEEWRASVSALSELIGRDVVTGAVPGGSYSRRVAQLAARAGITTLFTSEPVTTPGRVEDCLVVGRYLVRHGTRARDAARAAAGHPAPWLLHYLGWNTRKAAKAFSGRHYDRVRRRLLEVRYRPTGS